MLTRTHAVTLHQATADSVLTGVQWAAVQAADEALSVAQAAVDGLLVSTQYIAWQTASAVSAVQGAVMFSGPAGIRGVHCFACRQPACPLPICCTPPQPGTERRPSSG